MCGLAGVLQTNQARSRNDLRMIAELFTELLVGSEHRGPYATGVALINPSGDYYVSKNPVSASQFVTSRDYRLVIDKLGNDTTLLMGHTRWPTRGSHLDNANNHPLVGGGKSPCIMAHNGHVTNHHALSRLMNLKRDAEVDSEIILRLAERNVVESGIAPVSFAEDVSRCRGKLSAIVVVTSDPTKILVVKGNQPLAVRYHETCGLIAYASESEILDSAIGSDTGWEVVEIPAWRLVVVDTRRMMPLTAYPIPRRSNDENGRMPPCR